MYIIAYIYTFVKRLFAGVVGIVDRAGVDRSGVVSEVVVRSGVSFIAEVVLETEKIVGGDIKKDSRTFYNGFRRFTFLTFPACNH